MLDFFLTPMQSGGTTQNNGGSLLTLAVPFLLLIVVMYFIIIRPQKKKEKKEAELRNSIQVGDEVVTAGGIVGIVFSIKEDSDNKNNSTVVIETGGDRSKIRVKKWAIYSVETIHDTSVK